MQKTPPLVAQAAVPRLSPLHEDATVSIDLLKWFDVGFLCEGSRADVSMAERRARWRGRETSGRRLGVYAD